MVLKNLCRTWGLVWVAAFLSCALGAGPAEPDGNPTAPPPVHRLPTVVNPHLHLGTAATTQPNSASRGTRATRFDTRAYVASHRGLGTIHGEVITALGQPLADAYVVLRTPGGHTFASASLRHTTITAANGTFTMKGVRPGSYRVFAKMSGKHAYMKTAIAAKGVKHVVIKIEINPSPLVNIGDVKKPASKAEKPVKPVTLKPEVAKPETIKPTGTASEATKSNVTGNP